MIHELQKMKKRQQKEGDDAIDEALLPGEPGALKKRGIQQKGGV